MSPTTIALFAGRKEREREGNKCVMREDDDDDDIPRLCVSLAVFLFLLFLARLSVKKKKSFYCVVESSFSFLFFSSSDICGKSKLPSLYTQAIIIIQCFVQRAKTSLDIYKFNYTAVHSEISLPRKKKKD